ncbi:MAG: hypothetical protein DDT26_01625 [Dehalococcoidia bacterium]|nr:hypothetical protein [Chloroflexota bacterium]
MGLLVSVDAPKPLLNAGGIPGDVVVDRGPAELQVDALAGSICRHHEATPGAEFFNLGFSLRVRHSPVDVRHFPGIAQSFKTPYQEVHGVPVFGEDEELLSFESFILNDLTQLLELGLFSGFEYSSG